MFPRFQDGNIQKNQEIVAKVEQLAAAKSAKASQIALAWVMARGEDIVPIPGTKRRSYLEQNIAAAQLKLTADELAQLDAIAPAGCATGHRYPEAQMKHVNV